MGNAYRGRWSEYRASQVVPIGAGREIIQRSELKKRKEKKERKKADGERKRAKARRVKVVHG